MGTFRLSGWSISTVITLFEEIGYKQGVAFGVITMNIGILYADKQFEGYAPIKAETYLLKEMQVQRIGKKIRRS